MEAQESQDLVQINIQKAPRRLRTALKKLAALNEMDLQDYCREVLQIHVEAMGEPGRTDFLARWKDAIVKVSKKAK